jgi:hypothetical protein
MFWPNRQVEFFHPDVIFVAIEIIVHSDIEPWWNKITA